jgi:GNAT superfamily N-acetyltransferase
VSLVDCVRWAQSAEIEALEHLQRRAALVWEEYREHILAHPDAVQIPVHQVHDRRVRVATAGGRVLGFSVVLPLVPGAGELDGLFVEPDVMRRGVGRLLVADAVDIARDQGVRWIDVTANPKALGFYEKMGFVAGATVPTRFGPGLRMRLDVGV